MSLTGVPRDWYALWEERALTRARSAVRDGWQAGGPTAQSQVLAHCRDTGFRVHALLAAVPNFSCRQSLARLLFGSYGVARVHGHYRTPNIDRGDKRLCHLCLRQGRRAYDDEAHVLIDCPELNPQRDGQLHGLSRFFVGYFIASNREGNVHHEDCGGGPERMMPMLKAILYNDSGRIDVYNAYRIGVFLERVRCKRGRMPLQY